MPDIRTLTAQQRRALIAKTQELAKGGMAAKDIRQRLGLSPTTYTKWAKQYGFRACDLRARIADEVAALDSAEAVLTAVRAALARGEQGRADQLLRAWKQTARRARDLTALENAAALEAESREDETDPSIEALAAFLSDYTGRTIEVVD